LENSEGKPEEFLKSPKPGPDATTILQSNFLIVDVFLRKRRSYLPLSRVLISSISAGNIPDTAKSKGKADTFRVR